MASSTHLTDDNVTCLIKEVKKRGCVWNPEDENYNDRYHIASAWKEISKIIPGLPEDVIRTKWKNLRDLFKRIVKKRNYNTVDEYCGKWRHFKTLWFLHRPDDASDNETDNETHSYDVSEDIEANESNFIKLEPSETSEANVFLEEPEESPIPEKRRKVYTEDCYDTMFLKSLTPYLAKLDPMRKLVVRGKMQELLFNEIAAQNSSSNLYSMKKPSL